MAKEGVGGGYKGGGGKGGGGGKSKPGPRQPAGRKTGTAGPVKAGPRGTYSKGPGGKPAPASGGGAQGRGSWKTDSRPQRPSGGRPGESRASRGDAPRQPRREDGAGAGYRGKWEFDTRPGAGRPMGRPGETRGPRRAPETGGRPERGKWEADSRPQRPSGEKAAGRGEYRKPRGESTWTPKRTTGTDTRGPEQRGGREQDKKPPRSYGDRPQRPATGKPGISGGTRGAGPRDAARAYGERPAGRTGEFRGARPSAAGEERRPPVRKPVFEDKLHEPELENKVVGVNPVMELLKAGGRTVDTLFIDSTKGGKIFNDLITTARGLGITVKFAPKEALDGMSVGLRHQGAVAVVSPKEYADPDVLLAAAFAGETKPLFILLDGVEDPQNLGAVIRTADCAGVDGVFIPEHRAAHLSASVAKASAGAIEHVPVAKVGNMAKFIETLKERGVWVVGVEAGSDNIYTGFRMDVPVAVVLGSEGAGVRPVVLKSCDEVVSLPMFGHVNSLNVSVAAGIVLYEVLRQRMG